MQMETGVDLQAATPLLTALEECVHRSHAPFYTPGHKHGQAVSDRLRQLLGQAVFRADLPELPELDNLFAPQAAIAEAQKLAAIAFGAEQTWFLVNGSTGGIQAALLATCEPGDEVILPRNVHQSAIAGLILTGAVPVFVPPEYDPVLDIAHSVTPTAIATTLAQHPRAKAVFMVYPTYYGVGGDVSAIAQIAHAHGVPLLVDEAHAAHFAFHPDLPISALAAGADLTVQSTHKTLSAFTQAAMLHTQGTRLDRDRLSRALQLVQSTSPSYLLLASLDAARHQVATQGRELLAHTLRRVDSARDRLHQIPGLTTLRSEQAQSPGFVALDRTRLTVTVSGLGIDGFTADSILHTQLGVTAELPSFQHLTFIFTPGNTEEQVDRLVDGFEQLAKMAREPNELPVYPTPTSPNSDPNFNPNAASKSVPQTVLSPRQAFFAASEAIAIAQTVHRVSAELVCPYPPGIPVLMPGEIITEGAIATLQQVLAAGGMISGCADPTLQTLKVVV